MEWWRNFSLVPRPATFLRAKDKVAGLDMWLVQSLYRIYRLSDKDTGGDGDGGVVTATLVTSPFKK